MIKFKKSLKEYKQNPAIFEKKFKANIRSFFKKIENIWEIY